MKNLIILSGAGLSADSSVPTFRSQNGLWMNHDINVVCNYSTWKDNFDQVHTFYNNLRTLLTTVEPNPAHYLIAEWEKRYGERVISLTANVDDLLERAGCQNTLHLHGFLPNMQCTACGNIWNVAYKAWDCVNDRCPKCNSRRGVKPGVVFFNEGAKEYIRLNKVFRELAPADTVLVIGTSGQVINADALLFDKTCYKILNNLNQEQFVDDTLYDFVHYGRAAESVGILDKKIKEKME